MRKELTLMELVDRYLDGSMSGDERATFEARLQNDSDLRELHDDQRNIREGLERVSARNAAAKAYSAYRMGKTGPWVAGTLIIAVITASVFFLWQQEDPQGRISERTEHASQDHAGTTLLTDDRSDTLVLHIEADRDTTVLSPNGVVLDIPHGCFVDDAGDVITGNVRIDLVEAFSAASIMKAGLSTMSGDTVLETGGMMHLQATYRGRPVKINPEIPLIAMVPADPQQTGMKLYAGVKTEDGTIDWRDPRPLKSTLVPVDINTLDFYPPGYCTKLNELGQNSGDKIFSDSLYLAFAKVLHADGPMTADSLRASMGKNSGQWLYEAHCHSCHKPVDNMTGPAIAGARERWQGRGSLHEFVRDSQRMIRSGNDHAVSLFKKWNRTVMPPNDLTDEQIDKILDWVDDGGSERRYGIDPSKVMTIWNARFNNTNLATRAFEERMQAIHGTCDNGVLDAYVRSLDEDLSSVDARVVRMGHPSFAAFARRGDGRVELPRRSSERLARLYGKWSRAAAEATRKTQETFWDEQADKDRTAQELQDAQAQHRYEQELQRFQREYAANLTSACQQLGIAQEAPSREPPTLAYQVVIPRTGWWNIDKSTYWVTAERRNMEYIEPNTRKKVTVGYSPFTMNVVDRTRFDEVTAYLVPRELNSYQRMTDGGHLFREDLNKKLTYDVVCLARKDGQHHIAVQAVAPGSMEMQIDPVPVPHAELERILNSLGKEVARGLSDEARYMAWLRTDDQRRTANKARADLHNALLPIVLPCGISGSGTANNRRILDRPARYPFGEKALTELLTVSLRNEFDPLNRFIEGRVEIEFWVLEDGTIYQPRIAKVLYPGYDRKALDLFRNMPKWTPAIRNGKPVRLRYARDVYFVREGVSRIGNTVQAKE